MTSTGYCRLPASGLVAFAASSFRHAGMDEEDAEIAASALVRSNLRGIDTHGVNRLAGYVKGLRAGRMNPRPVVRADDAPGAALLVDGDRGLGHVVSTRAMQLCIARARDTGIAFAAVRDSSHNGAASLYALMAAETGMIGLSMTGGGVRVAPAGGREALLGTNPIAFAAPTAEEPTLCMDMATSVVSGGKVEQYAEEGRSLVPGWALDPEGRPTTDSKAGNRGPLLPLGSTLELSSYKGYALSLMVETLCNVLTGMATGPERARRTGTGRPGMGHFLGAISIERYQPLDDFRARLDENLRLLRGSEPMEGCARIYTPGEREWDCERERRSAGIPVHATTMASLQELSRGIGAALPEPLD